VRVAAIAQTGSGRLLELAAWFERERPWEQRLSELRRRYLAAGAG